MVLRSVDLHGMAGNGPGHRRSNRRSAARPPRVGAVSADTFPREPDPLRPRAIPALDGWRAISIAFVRTTSSNGR